MADVKELLANIPPFGLRMQADLKERVKKAAEGNGRSMNAEIVAYIESALESPDRNASELLRMLADERKMNANRSKLLESQFDLLENYKGVMQSGNAQNIQQARIIKSLCSIILSLNASPEILDMAQRISEASEGIVRFAKDTAILENGRPEIRDADKMIDRADELLKKRED
ncbi:Arc family DNA-binding protein [Rhizobium sp. RAF56]|uniref:Arc family DNA-binding protein n=1 Tax=Rhizobium sp. RAF56 TaxID=3233062 RepID=UPI003F9E07E6